MLTCCSKLIHPDDLQADDLGNWVHKGKPIRYFEVVCSPTGIVYDIKPCNKDSANSYKLT